MKLKISIIAALGALALTSSSSMAGNSENTNWLDHTISPVANPIYFEDANITSEIRPIYMWHNLPSKFEYNGGTIGLGGHVQVIAVQARYAITDRLAFIATKDGYVQFQPDADTAGGQALGGRYGWADIAAGLKYALVKDDDSQFMLTPGLTVTIPTGNRDVWQGHGAGEENIFVSGIKGFGDFHILGNVGVRIPNNWAADTCQAHYSLQADYYIGKYFIPFVALNGYTVLSEGNNKLLGAIPLNAEMYDLINFGATDAGGSTQLSLGVGFRSRILRNLDFGLAYESGLIDPKGIFDSRVTVDMIFRF